MTEKVQVTAVRGEKNGQAVMRLQYVATAMWVTQARGTSAKDSEAVTFDVNTPFGERGAKVKARFWAVSNGFAYIASPDEGGDTAEAVEVGGPPPFNGGTSLPIGEDGRGHTSGSPHMTITWIN